MADSDQPLQPRFDYDPGSTIFLLVGEEQEQMLVHASYLSSRSEFFRAALSKDWKESRTRIIKLPEDDPQTVAQYLDFTYQGRLPTHQSWTPSQTDSMYLALARLYVYGERVLDTAIRNIIVEHLIAFSSIANHDLPTHPHYPGPEVVEMVYDGTTAASPIRRFLVDMYVRFGQNKWMDPELHPAFLQDVARELIGRVVHGNSAMRKDDYLVAQ